MSYLEIPRPPDEAARDVEILRSGVLFLGPDPRLTAMVESARARFGTAMAALTIIHREWQHVVAAAGVTPGTYPRSTSFCGYTILDPAHAFCVSDASVDARLAGHPNVVGGGRIRFYAGSPLVSGGVALGALCVFDTVTHPCLDAAGEEALRRMAADAMAMVKTVARRIRR